MASILSQSEVASLLAALEPLPGARESQSVQPVLPRGDGARFRGGSGPLDGLSALLERFARELSESLGRMTRGAVGVTLRGIESTTCGEFGMRLDSPTCLHRLEGPPFSGSLLLDLSPSIVFPLVDRLLGGSSAVPAHLPQRTLTEIEQRLLSRLVDAVLASLQAACSEQFPLALRVAQTASSARLLAGTVPDGAALCASFEVAAGTESGLLSLCFPQVAVQCLAGQLEGSDSGGEGGDRRDLRSALAGLVVYLPSARLTTDEIDSLAEGDVIMTEHRCDGSVVVCVEGERLFAGAAGVSRGFKAVRINSAAAGSSD